MNGRTAGDDDPESSVSGRQGAGVRKYLEVDGLGLLGNDERKADDDMRFLAEDRAKRVEDDQFIIAGLLGLNVRILQA